MERCRRGSGSLGTVLADSDDFLDTMDEPSTSVLEWSAMDDEVGEAPEVDSCSAAVTTCRGFA